MLTVAQKFGAEIDKFGVSTGRVRALSVDGRDDDVVTCARLRSAAVALLLVAWSMRWRGLRRRAGSHVRSSTPSSAATARRCARCSRSRPTSTRAEPDGTTALHWAVRANDVELVDDCCCGPAPMRRPPTATASPPMTLAATNGSAEVARRAARRPAPIANTQTAGGRAGADDRGAHRQRRRRCRLLVGRGADVNAREQWFGETALMWAAAENHADAVRVAGRGRRRRQRAVDGARGAGARVPAQRRTQLAVSARRLDGADVRGARGRDRRGARAGRARRRPEHRGAARRPTSR